MDEDSFWDLECRTNVHHHHHRHHAPPLLPPGSLLLLLFPRLFNRIGEVRRRSLGMVSRLCSFPLCSVVGPSSHFDWSIKKKYHDLPQELCLFSRLFSTHFISIFLPLLLLGKPGG